MTHIDKIAEYVFQELSTAEATVVENHLAECSDCRTQVEQFRYTYAVLRTSPDAPPPRSILFEFQKPRTASWLWRWLAPMTASAAVAWAVVNIAPKPAAQPQIVERIVQQPAAQPVDYQQLLEQLRASDRVWLANELKKYDAAHATQFQRMRADVDSLAYQQHLIERDQMENARSVQLLAAGGTR